MVPCFRRKILNAASNEYPAAEYVIGISLQRSPTNVGTQIERGYLH